MRRFALNNLFVALGIYVCTLAQLSAQVYVTARPQPTGTGANTATATGTAGTLPVYSELPAAAWSDTSGVSVAAGGGASPTRAGSRIRTSATAGMGFSVQPVLPTSGGTYLVEVVIPNTSINASSDIVISVTAASGCTVSSVNTTALQQVGTTATPAANGDVWRMLCRLTCDPGVNQPKITVTYVSGTISGGGVTPFVAGRFYADAVRFTEPSSPTSILWSSAGNSAWFTVGNWTGSVLPGAPNVAQFGVNPTSGTTGVGINMATPTIGYQPVGAIEMTSARTANLIIGNSSSATSGTLRIFGVTLNSVANTVLRNNGAGSVIMTIQNNQGGSTGTTMPVNFNTPASAVIDATKNITISSAVTAANGVTKIGAGLLTFSANSIFSGNTTISVGNLRLQGGGYTYAGAVSIASGTEYQLYNDTSVGNITLSGVISGLGGLLKNVPASTAGADVIVSSGLNSYAGGTQVRGGFYGLGADNCLGTGNVTIGWDPNPLGLFASSAARLLTNDVVFDVLSTTLSAAIGSTNIQIRGSQPLTLSGRVLIHTNITYFTISNTAVTTLSGVVTNASVTSAGINKIGPGKLVLSAANTFSGSTTVGAGILALTGSGSINNSTNIMIFGGATFDISGLGSALALSNSQTLRGVSTNGATGKIILSAGAGLTLSSNSPIVLAYTNGTPVLAVTNGVLTINSNNPATVTVANGGAVLPLGDYKLISTNTDGFISGSAPTNLTVIGDGVAGGSAYLVISNAELYLRVGPLLVPPGTPVANVASSTNFTTFNASWNAVLGATGYRLDVSIANDFSSFVSSYNDRDAGAGTSFVVTNLSPGTVLYYRMRATNDFGASGNSAPIAVTTLVAPFVWNTGDGYWSTAGSWQDAAVPGNGAAPGFTGAGGNSTNDLTDLLLNSLTFSNGAGAYVVSGNALVVTNGIINNSTANETISAPLTLGATETFSAVSGPLTIAGPVTNAGNRLTMSATANITNSGAISGSGALVKSGSGTLVLSGANTYTGPTTNNAGTLQVAGGSALPDAALVVLANTSGVTLALDASETVGSISSGDNSTISLGANNLSAGGDGTTFTNVAAITGTGKLVKTGAGTLVLNKATAYGSSFNLRVEGGTVDLNRGGSLLTGILGVGNRIELAGGTLQLTASAQANYVMAIAGLDIYSDSTLRYNRTASNSQTPTNTFPLNFKANAVLSLTYNNITANTAVFNGAANTLEGNASFDPGAFVMTILNPIGESGGSYGITKLGTGQLNLNGVNTYSGNTTNALGVIAVNDTSTLGSGTLVFAGGDLLDSNSRATVPIANPILLTSAGTSTIYGNSSLAASSRIFPLSGVLSGSTGTLRIGNRGVATTTFIVRLLAGGFTFSRPIIVGDSTYDTNGALNVLSFNSDNTTGPQVFTGIISGTGSVMRDDPTTGIGGTTVLTGANTYSGGTTLTNGTILVNNATGSGTGSGAITVRSDATLGGTGIVSGVITVQLGGTLAPGSNAIGTLTVGSIPVFSGTNYLEIDKGASPNTDKLVLSSGALAFGGTLTVTNIGAALTGGEVFDLFDAASFTGTFITNLPALSAGLNWATNNLTVDGSIKVNRAPVATTVTSNCTPGLSLAIQITGAGSLATDLDGDTLSVTTAGASPEGTNLVFTAGSDKYIYYQNTNAAAASDSFTYTVTDGFGGSDTKTITINLAAPNNSQLQGTLFTPELIGGGSEVRLKLLGYPLYKYAVEWSTNLPDPWTILATNQADATGLLIYTNNAPDPSQNFYRTRWVP